MFAPPLISASALLPQLDAYGYAVLGAESVCALAGTTRTALASLEADWAALVPDDYLKDGGRYRRRRHASFTLAADGALAPVPHRAHWQPVQYNALHGGMSRWFEPVAPATWGQPAWGALIGWLGRVAQAHFVSPGASSGDAPPSRPAWFGEAHQFRIDTEGGIGRPTPEGAHRDGVDLVAVFLVARVGIKGGETRVFEVGRPDGIRFTLTQPWSVLLMDDARVMHETTPIQPAVPGAAGHRDTLVVTLRAGGFPGP